MNSRHVCAESRSVRPPRPDRLVADCQARPWYRMHCNASNASLIGDGGDGGDATGRICSTR
jgi:hypothetical protein